jgi:hypothetical protein
MNSNSFPNPYHSLGNWGKKRLDYLREHNKPLILQMTTSELLEHCTEIEESAQAIWTTMMTAIRKNPANKVTEKDKAEDPIAWAGHMNNFKHKVHEVIYNDLIYS